MKFRHRMGGGVETGFCHKIDFLQKCNMYITLYYISSFNRKNRQNPVVISCIFLWGG